MNIVAEKPSSVNDKLAHIRGTPKKVIQWLTVWHEEGGIASYPMVAADEGLALLECGELLRSGKDKVLGITPCQATFYVVKDTKGEYDMGETPEEAEDWARSWEQ